MSQKEIQLSLLDTEDEPQLMSAIVDIMQENDAHNLVNFDHEYWNWQYKNLPTHKTNVFVGRDPQKNILAYYHVPYYMGKWGNGETPYAMIQDVAVSNQLRGQGLFSKIATFANKHIDEIGTKVIYTFPNHRSIHTFLKYNDFKLLSSFNAYILPVNVALLIKSKINLFGIEKIIGGLSDIFFRIFSIGKPTGYKIDKVNEFTDEAIAVYKDFATSFDYGLVKDKKYLNWRFIEKPKQSNFIFTIRNRNGEMKAVAVLKKDTIKGIPCLLLMDFAYSSGDGSAYFLRLITSLRNNHKQYFNGEVGLIFTSMNSGISDNLFRAGFIKLPQKVNPRPLNLLIRTNENQDGVQNNNNWHVTLCDWDVF